jgi:decaprenyl-phosphate phosphoribosyltransferase
MRPSHWVKNVVIVVAPAAAGVLFHAATVRHTVVAFFAFCAVASALYIVNDLRDLEGDRLHPTKRFRAIASGQLSHTTALIASGVLLLIGFLLPLLIARAGQLYLVLGIYAAISLAYDLWLKNIAIIELGAVASGFFLRAYAGAAASHLFVSSWFLVVISFGALFLVVGKRDSELKNVEAGTTRRVLTEYTSSFLDSALTLCSTVVVTAYCLWAFDTSSSGLSANHDATVPVRLSVIPVVLAVLYVLRAIEGGRGETPEELVLHHREIQGLMLLWVVLLAIGVYA